MSREPHCHPGWVRVQDARSRGKSARGRMALRGEEKAGDELSSHWDVTLMSPWTPDNENVKARAGGDKKGRIPKPGGAVCAPQIQAASEKRPASTGPGPHRPSPPLARPPARRSPSSSRWMILSMLSLSISAIAVPPPTLPQRRRRRLAPGSHSSSFLTPRAPRAVVAAAVAAAAAAGPPPSRPAPGFLLLSPLEPREEQNGRRLLRPASGGARMRARECSGWAGTSLQAHRARGRGRGRLREGGGVWGAGGRSPGRDG